MVEVTHVCTCFDQQNADAALVMLSSAIKNKRSGTILHLHAVTTCDGDKEFKSLEAPGVCVSFYHVENLFSGWKGNDYISPATYLRFMIQDILPKDINRVLYLDADTIVLTDLSELYNTDFKGMPLAAMPDYGLVLGSPYWLGYKVSFKGTDYSFNEYCADVLKIDNSRKISYFNAGVLLINLETWRPYSLKAVSFLEANPGLPFLDQDALSRVLEGNFIPLHPSFNAFSDLAAPDGRSFLDKVSGFAKRYHKVKKIWRDNPKIVHYAGSNKPWDEHAKVTGLERYWWEYAESTSVYSRYERFSCQKRNVKAEPRRV
jgi:lipopolysaccharide biosynthesis glycosyltransferase